MSDSNVIVVEGEIVDEGAVFDARGNDAAIGANEAFRARLDARSREAEVLRVLRQTRNAARLIALLVAFLVVVLLSGCSDERAWAIGRREQQRIDHELTAAGIVPADQLDAMRTIVHGRPRPQAETPSNGLVEAAARVDQERIALFAAESKYREALRSVTNPAGAGQLPPELAEWQRKVKRARRILLVAELAPSMPEWGPVTDQIVSEELANTPSNIVPRPLPPSESLRLERARKAFNEFLRAFEEVQP